MKYKLCSREMKQQQHHGGSKLVQKKRCREPDLMLFGDTVLDKNANKKRNARPSQSKTCGRGSKDRRN